MKQALQNLRTGEVSVREVPPPALRRGGVLVATLSSLISAGTERNKIELGEKSMLGKARARPELARQVVEKARQDGVKETYRTVIQRLEAPNLLGYSAAGRVLSVAPDVPGIEVGDLVACSGAGYANHAEVNFIPKNLIARVPDGVSADQAAYGTLGCIAMHGVRQSELGLGDRVLVVGLGLVGLITAQLARAAGARVFGTDLDPAACLLAESLGVERAVPRAGIETVIDEITGGVGVDAVVICAATASNDPIELAAQLVRNRGRVVLVGTVGLTLPRDPFYLKEIDLRYSRSYGPGRYDPGYEEHGNDYPVGYVRWTEQRNLDEFLRLVRDGRVDVDTLTTHRLPVDEAAAAYALISGKATDPVRPIGVLLQYPDDHIGATRSRIAVKPGPRPTAAGGIGIAMVGGGNFATRVLLPALMATDKAQPVGITTSGGATAHQVARTYGFGYSTSDSDALIHAEDVDAVVIATRHDSHATLAAQALRAGKATFCEKPLATTWDDLEHVASAWAETRAPLLVGFNRRYSPLTTRLQDALPRGVPRVMIARCNAGALPKDHWMRDSIFGGGRIVGELCHFLDLACALAEGRPLRVSAEALSSRVSSDTAESADTVVVQIAFSCGSIASLQYVGNGDPSIPKERVEVYCGGTVGIIDDFFGLEMGQHGKRKRSRGRRQEKGHREEMRIFADLAAGLGDPDPVAEAAFWSSSLTLQVPWALAQGRAVMVDLPQALGGRGADAGVAGTEVQPS